MSYDSYGKLFYRYILSNDDSPWDLQDVSVDDWLVGLNISTLVPVFFGHCHRLDTGVAVAVADSLTEASTNFPAEVDSATVVVPAEWKSALGLFEKKSGLGPEQLGRRSWWLVAEYA